MSRNAARRCAAFFWGAGLLAALGCGASPELAPSTPPAPQLPGAAAPATGPRSGSCDAMSAKLRSAYEAARACARDEDCNYVEGYYAVVPREETGLFITTLACGGRTPFLVVGNGARVQAGLSALRSGAVAQAQACADPFDSSSEQDECSTIVGFVPAGPPTCRAGRCQAVRGEEFHGIP